MSIGLPSESRSVSGGAGTRGVATLPRYCGLPGSELELPPQAASPRPTASSVAAAAAVRGNRIRTPISAQAPQSSVQAALGMAAAWWITARLGRAFRPGRPSASGDDRLGELALRHRGAALDPEPGGLVQEPVLGGRLGERRRVGRPLELGDLLGLRLGPPGLELLADLLRLDRAVGLAELSPSGLRRPIARLPLGLVGAGPLRGLARPLLGELVADLALALLLAALAAQPLVAEEGPGDLLDLPAGPVYEPDRGTGDPPHSFVLGDAANPSSDLGGYAHGRASCVLASGRVASSAPRTTLPTRGTPS